ncbi:hypothetical protein AXK12_01705 [Cephaloticoccus capnophilus]|uniref:Uncharacterized protein n=1 Tax=Cephaloticoccus capnophilus TaxID=1548208 RepID=A0A139SS49_9BACT|nr:hypothetical protein [Cephaloticoccus capnophilus]KXU37419.1 hypothetical protein AXK12_01705 [Cephaloticoccus capnophilus]
MNTVTDREYAELRKMMVETDAIIAQMRKMNDEREKLRAETMKMQTETKWHPVRYVGGVAIGTILFVAALVGILKAFLQ